MAGYKDTGFSSGDDSYSNPHLLSQDEKRSDILYRQIKGYIYSAIAIRSEDVAKTRFRVYRQKVISGEPHTEEIYDHPVCSLIRKPHPDLTWYELLLMTVQNMDAAGNFYWLKVRNRMKAVVYYVPVFPRYITIAADAMNFVSHYHYKDRVREYDIPREDIIHFRHPKAGDMFYGQSIISAISDVVNVNNLQLRYQVESFSVPVPQATLQTDQPLDETAAKRLQAEFKAKYGGISRLSSIPVLDRGLQLVMQKHETREIDFINSRKGLRDEILSAFRVPANKLGIVTDTNRANAESANFSYLSNAIEPLCRYISMKLTQDCQSEYNDESLIIRNDDVVPRDVDAKLRYYDSGLKYGWLTVDEVREEEGMKASKKTKSLELKT